MEEHNPGLTVGETRKRTSAAKRKRGSLDNGGEKKDSGDSIIADIPHGPESAESSKRDKPDVDSLQDAMASYAYLFPDLGNFNLPGNGAASAFDPDFNVTPNQPMNNGYPYSLFRAPAPGPSGQQQYQGQGVSLNTPNLSGFGVTGPAPGWPVASTSQPAVQLSGGMDPLTPSMYGSTPSSGTGTKSKSPINGAERQRQLRQAVAIITKNESSGKMDGGPETSLAEIEHNMRLQNQLRQSMEENEGPDLKTEAMQVGELVQSR